MLQIGMGKKDLLGIILHTTPLNIYCDPSVEPSHRDGSDEGSQQMFLLRKKEKLSLNFSQYPLFSGALIVKKNL